jgi:hypothetical protein
MINFFIVGTGRCGTTLVRNILNLNSDIYIPTESHWIPILYEMYGMAKYSYDFYMDVVNRTYYANNTLTINRMLEKADVSKTEFENLLRTKFEKNAVSIVEFNNYIYQLIGEKNKSSLYGDKTPDYGAYMSLLQYMWPNSKFIHIIRDGRDVSLSMSYHVGFKRMISLGVTNWVPVAFNSYYKIAEDKKEPLIKYIRLWQRRIERILDEAGRLAPASYLFIHYEDLISKPEEEIWKIADFLKIAVTKKWINDANGIIKSNNTDKIEDNNTYNILTNEAYNTLKELGYSTKQKIAISQ